MVVMATSSGASAQPGLELLGTAHSYAVLAGQTVTSTGATILTGDLGVSPGGAIVGFPPGVVVGTIHAGDAEASQAQTDLIAAYNTLAGLPSDVSLTGQDLGGLTLIPGVYTFASGATLGAGLTLDAQGDPNATFVFQIASTIITSSNSSVTMINSGSGCNVYWQVGSSATLGSNTSFQGSILALTSITLNTGSSVTNGRLLARNGSITLGSNAVTNAVCLIVPVRQVPHASADADGRVTITFVNAQGHPTMLQRDTAGDWTKESLDETAPPVMSTMNRYATHTWVAPDNGKSYVSVASRDGLLVVDTAVMPLAVRNLTTELLIDSPDASAITGVSTVFNSEGGRVNIVGVNDLGELVRYFQTGAIINGESVWEFMNITTTQLNPFQISTPTFASNLISYVSEWGGLHVAGLDSQGDVIAVWWAPGAPHWWVNNVSADSEAPPYMVEAGLTAYATPWGGLNLAGLDAQGHVIVQWWSPALGAGNWISTDLTESFGGPVLDGTGLTSFVLPWGALNVAGVTPAGELVNYWWLPGFDEWVITSISAATAEPDPSRLTGALIGVASPTGVASIIGESLNGDMIRYLWQPGDGGTWHTENITDIATPRP
ncbi:MAG: DUF3494 domain-containing protein [Pyrinomonadaceae bacterium]|nr:DUF3494 domain-containing protein [Phycisphaerales bacterium]